MNLWNSILLLSIKYNFFSSRNEIILFKSMINLTNNYRMRGWVKNIKNCWKYRNNFNSEEIQRYKDKNIYYLKINLKSM